MKPGLCKPPYMSALPGSLKIFPKIATNHHLICMKDTIDSEPTFIEFLEDCPEVLGLARIDITFDIYEEVWRIVCESDEDELLIDDIVHQVQDYMKQDNMVCLTARQIVDLIMSHFSKRGVITPLTPEDLRQDISRIVWRALARGMNPSASIQKNFITALIMIIRTGNISALEVADRLCSDPRFETIPRNSVENVVIDVFYLLAGRGLYDIDFNRLK